MNFKLSQNELAQIELGLAVVDETLRRGEQSNPLLAKIKTFRRDLYISEREKIRDEVGQRIHDAEYDDLTKQIFHGVIVVQNQQELIENL